jgi:hypothetical protein
MKTIVYYALAAALSLGAGLATAQAPDVTAVIGDDGGSNYFLNSFSPPSANLGAIGVADPRLNLVIGKRYQFTVSSSHPMAIARLGPDTILLAQGADVGTFEGTASVNWVDNFGLGTFTFTLTPALAEAMVGQAGYFCQVHPGDMRGFFITNSAPSALVWPGGTDSYENALLTTSVASITGYSIINGGASYTATIANTPAAMPGQFVGSTRWMQIADTDAALSNRVYGASINAAPDQVRKYKFAFHTLVQNIAAGNSVLWISQHDVSGVFNNVAGLELTDTGVNVIIVGTTDPLDAGIGKTGATTRTLLYNFADTGGFGLNNWVLIGFEVDLVAGSVTGSAVGSGGVITKTATLTGLLFSNPSASPQKFRMCFRNNKVGSTSTINYDNLTLVGTALVPSGVNDWNLFSSNEAPVNQATELQAAASPVKPGNVLSELFPLKFITTQCPKGDQCTCGE